MLPPNYWAKVREPRNPDQCWDWIGSLVGGYGHVRVGPKVKKAHRLSYEHFHGPIPADKIVMHSCDNPACVNPAHLSLGTQADNSHDRDRKGRQVALRGEQHGMAKLHREAIAEVRAFARRVDKERSALAKKFGVTKTTISDVMQRKTWNWVK